MAAPISPTRLAAARALMSLEAPIRDRVAACMGINVATLIKHAAREGWVLLDFRRRDVREAHAEMKRRLTRRFLLGVIDDAPSSEENSGDVAVPAAAMTAPTEMALTEEATEHLSLDEQLLRVGAMLSRQIGLFIAIVERSRGVIKKVDLDALSVLLRLAERFDAMAAERAAEHQKRSDDEVAGILERVDERIVELAHAHAERLGRGEPDE